MFTPSTVATLRKKRALRGRRIVLIDIENVVGGAVTDPRAAEVARVAIREAIGRNDQDQVVIGTSHVGLLNVAMSWPGSRCVVRSGRDGADLALLEVMMCENLAGRFDRVVLASGDGIFCDAVARLGSQGVHVTVVSNPAVCSKRLHMASAATLFLDPATLAIGDAA